MNQSNKSFFGGLESLRGVAAFIVVFLHITWPNPLTQLRFFRNGYLMVDLFFVLSGFVIFFNYGQKIGSIRNIGRFMFLRFGRLYPLHLFCLFAFLGIEVAKYIGESRFHLAPAVSSAFSINNTSSFIAHLLLIQSFCPFANYSFNGPSWSISTEFYAYLVFAIVTVFFSKRKCILIGGGVILLTTFLLIHFGVSGDTSLTGWSFLRCILGFFTGVLTYQIYNQYHSRISRWSERSALCLLATLVIFMSIKENPQIDGILALPIFSALIIFIAAEPAGSFSKVINSFPLRWLGQVSYSIYLMHYMVLMFMSRCAIYTQKHLPPNDRDTIGLVFVFVAIGLVLLISQLTYQWIEKPFQNKSRELSQKYFGGWQTRT